MRRAWTDTAFIVDDGDTVGINLGFDFVAEHEWGISDLLRDFGIPKEPTEDCFGFDARTTRRQSDRLHYMEYKNFTYLVNCWNYAGYGGSSLTHENFDSYIGKDYGNTEHGLACAWGGQEFAIRVNDDYGRKVLKSLKDSFDNNDVAIFLGRQTNPFSRSGLNIVTASKIPQYGLDEAKKVDLSHFKITKAAKATGIEERLKNAGKGWFALSPKWVSDEEKEVEFFLNPHEQDRYNYGWFTVEELEQWAEDKGPVVK